MAGEFALLSNPRLSWHRYGNGCMTSSHVPLANGQTLEEQMRRAPHAPYWYRWGVENWIAPNASAMNQSHLEQRIDSALARLDMMAVQPWVDWCDHHPNSLHASIDRAWHTMRASVHGFG